jgi:hypothetical protein
MTQPETSQLETQDIPIQQPARTGVSFLTVIFIAASIAAFSAIILVWYVQTRASVASGTQKLVFVDGNAIFKAQVKAFTAGSSAGSPDAAQKSAKEFLDKFNAALAPYKEAGYIILNSTVVVSAPDGSDITALVAKQVGLNLAQ